VECSIVLLDCTGFPRLKERVLLTTQSNILQVIHHVYLLRQQIPPFVQESTTVKDENGPVLCLGVSVESSLNVYT
jgi:hypothetical protein